MNSSMQQGQAAGSPSSPSSTFRIPHPSNTKLTNGEYPPNDQVFALSTGNSISSPGSAMHHHYDDVAPPNPPPGAAANYYSYSCHHLHAAEASAATASASAGHNNINAMSSCATSSMSVVSERNTAMVKRDRNDQDCYYYSLSSSSSLHYNVPPPLTQQLESASKKTRHNGYIAPRQIPATFTSQVGSLAVGNSAISGNSTITAGGNNDMRQVGFRRQLSSSKIECFLGGDHDAMDVDADTPRPRSMSF